MSKITMRKSTTAGAKPTTGQLANGELAINVADGRLYFLRDKAGAKSIVEVASIVCEAVADWNQITAPGNYYGDSLASNGPEDGAAHNAICYGWSAAELTAIAVKRSTNRAYYRRRSSGGWGPWVEILNKADFGATLATELPVALGATGNPGVYAARAWVNFNGGGTPAIRASKNVSSITDNGVGNYTVNFTTAMPDANYAAIATSAQNATGAALQYAARVSDLTTAGCRVSTATEGTSTNTLADNAVVSLAVFR